MDIFTQRAINDGLVGPSFAMLSMCLTFLAAITRPRSAGRKIPGTRIRVFDSPFSPGSIAEMVQMLDEQLGGISARRIDISFCRWTDVAADEVFFVDGAKIYETSLAWKIVEKALGRPLTYEEESAVDEVNRAIRDAYGRSH